MIKVDLHSIATYTISTYVFRDFDSSSFEHVFVGECREDEFIGLHNWLQIYLQEKAGIIDYHGYFRRETVIFHLLILFLYLFWWLILTFSEQKQLWVTSLCYLYLYFGDFTTLNYFMKGRHIYHWYEYEMHTFSKLFLCNNWLGLNTTLMEASLPRGSLHTTSFMIFV